MKLLVDENVHGDLVLWFRSIGVDVRYAAETSAGESDQKLLEAAHAEQRVIVTDDKDFGELVFHRKLAAHGVLLMRLTDPSIEARLDRLRSAWPAIHPRLEYSFVVLGDKKIRIRPLT